MARATRAAAFRIAPTLAARILRPTDAELGLAGERIAERRLRRAGLVLVARRMRTRYGEVDLVLTDGRWLVVCEVKTARRPGLYGPGQRLGAEGLERRRRAAQGIARAGGHRRWRVDLVEVVVTPRPSARKDRRRWSPRFPLGRPAVSWAPGIASSAG